MTWDKVLKQKKKKREKKKGARTVHLVPVAPSEAQHRVMSAEAGHSSSELPRVAGSGHDRPSSDSGQGPTVSCLQKARAFSLVLFGSRGALGHPHSCSLFTGQGIAGGVRVAGKYSRPTHTTVGMSNWRASPRLPLLGGHTAKALPHPPWPH